MMRIVIIFDVDYDYFLRELLSLMWIMIIFDVSYDDLFSYLCLCDASFIS